MTNLVFSMSVPAGVKALAQASTDLGCQMCGAAIGDQDSFVGETVNRLHIDYPPDDRFATGRPHEFQVTCSICHDGNQGLITTSPAAVELLSQVRRAGQDEQRAVYGWLKKKFGED